jgi:hypothetical protein
VAHKDTPFYQLAFCQVLRDMLPNLEGSPECYDPKFNDVDRSLLLELGYTVCHTRCSAPQLLVILGAAEAADGLQWFCSSTNISTIRLACQFCPFGSSSYGVHQSSVWLLGHFHVSLMRASI